MSHEGSLTRRARRMLDSFAAYDLQEESVFPLNLMLIVSWDNRATGAERLKMIVKNASSLPYRFLHSCRDHGHRLWGLFHNSFLWSWEDKHKWMIPDQSWSRILHSCMDDGLYSSWGLSIRIHIQEEDKWWGKKKVNPRDQREITLHVF